MNDPILVALLAVTAVLFLSFALAKLFSRQFKLGNAAGFADGLAAGRLQESRRIKGDAHWFSEDVATMILIDELAAGEPVSSVRDRWRENRKKHAAQQNASVGTGIVGGTAQANSQGGSGWHGLGTAVVCQGTEHAPGGPSAHMCPACGLLVWGANKFPEHFSLASVRDGSCVECSGSNRKCEPLPDRYAVSPQGCMTDNEASQRRTTAKTVGSKCKGAASLGNTHVITRFGDFMTVARATRREPADLEILGVLSAFPELGPCTLRLLSETIVEGVRMTDEEAEGTGLYIYR